jgi:hypothetical protein
MINVTLGEVKPQGKPFPKLMKHPDGTIMLFWEPSRGICLVGGGSTNNGYVSLISEGMSMGLFTDYNDPITIQNA